MDTTTRTNNGAWEELGKGLSYDEALVLAEGRLIAVIVAKFPGPPHKTWVIPETEAEYNEAVKKGHEVYAVTPGEQSRRRITPRPRQLDGRPSKSHYDS